MRKLLGILLCLLSSAGFSQYGSARGSNGDFNKMAEILPPAPDASAIARYGGVDVQLSTGSVNKSIPLKAFTFRDLTIPISFGYASTGLKVNELPSRVGMGWSYSGGGQISRVVYGFDDFTKTRSVPDFNYEQNEDNVGLTTFCWNFEHGPYDSQPDIFSFNFGGYSGKFVFDHQGNIAQIPATNLKISFNSAYDPTWTFKITTPEGVQYFFGGANAKDKTKRGGNLTTFPAYTDNVWYLNKVTHPNGYSITLNYQTDIFGPYKIGVTEAKYKAAWDSGIPLTYTWFDGNSYHTEYMYGLVPGAFSNDEYATSTASLLSSITAEDGSHMEFTYSPTGYPEKLLQTISYFNQKNIQTGKYKLDYYIASSLPTPVQSLPFLKTIQEVDYFDHPVNNGYQLDYLNRNSVPSRCDKSQDHWGYYNGISNSTLIPPPDDPNMQGWFTNAIANRNPNATYAGNGLLSKIIYPTGGRDEIEYEGNVLAGQQDINPYNTVTESITGTGAFWGPESAGSSFSVTYENIVKLTVRCYYTGSGTYDPLHDGGKIRIVDLSNSQTVYSNTVVPSSDFQITNISLASGSYRLYVSSRGADIRTEATAQYRTGSAPVWQDINVPLGGMRVKYTKTIDHVTGKQNVIRYYYGPITDYNKSSALAVPKPIYFKVYKEVVSMGSLDLCDPVYKIFEHKAMYSNTINSMYIYSGGPVNYRYISISYGGDNFENGAVEHKFQIVPDMEAQLIRGDYIQGVPVTNSSYLSDREMETTSYKKNPITGALVRIQYIVNEYTDEPVRKFNDIRCWVIDQNVLPWCTGWGGNQITGPFPFAHLAFNVQKYYLTSAWCYLSKVTKNEYDQNGLNPLTAVTNYYYDDDRNLMVSRVEVLNSKNQLVKTQYKYPHDFAISGNVYDQMVTRNMIAQTIEEKSSKDLQLLSTQKNNYDNTWFADNHIIALKNVELAKGNNQSESRFRFTKYDTYGHPVELSKENDVKESFVWDYNNAYPVAKVKNASDGTFAYTSFESDGLGGWTMGSGSTIDYSKSVTGDNSFSGTLSKTVPAGNYTVTAWSNISGSVTVNGSSGTPLVTKGIFTLYKWNLTNPGSISISGANIDEVRLHPKDADMTTNTYRPSVGVTSTCDINNNITYYEYDEVGRLVLVRDGDRNIVKKFCYNYAGMSENCTIYYNDQKSQVFTKACASGYTGSQVTYFVRAGKYISTVSVLEANNLAQAEITANGQAFANANGTCVQACNQTQCANNGPAYKCVNGQCEQGVKMFTSSAPCGLHCYNCTYHYLWSDGSVSQNYTEIHTTPCPID